MSTALTVAGGAFEIGGLALAFTETRRIELRRFPERRGNVRRRTVAAVRWVLRREQPTTPVGRSVGMPYEIDTAMPMTVKRPEPKTVPERLARLEANVDELRRAQKLEAQRLDESTAALQHTLRTETAALHRMFETRDQVERADVQDALLLQKVGGGLFVVGVVLGVLGNIG